MARIHQPPGTGPLRGNVRVDELDMFDRSKVPPRASSDVNESVPESGVLRVARLARVERSLEEPRPAVEASHHPGLGVHRRRPTPIEKAAAHRSRCATEMLRSCCLTASFIEGEMTHPGKDAPTAHPQIGRRRRLHLNYRECVWSTWNPRRILVRRKRASPLLQLAQGSEPSMTDGQPARMRPTVGDDSGDGGQLRSRHDGPSKNEHWQLPVPSKVRCWTIEKDVRTAPPDRDL
jgi:hypothetical protein